MKNQKKLRTFLGEELIDIMAAINQSDNLLAGLLKCKNCGAQIDDKNLMAIVPLNGNRYDFICSKPKCLLTLQKLDKV